MSRIFFYIMLALGAGAALAIFLKDDPGYVLVSFRGWSLETTLGSVILALLALFISFVGLLWLIKTINPIKLLRKTTWQHIFGSGKPEQVSANGMQLLLLGSWQEAYKLLVENAERVQNPVANYMAASIAAFKRGDMLGCMFCLDRAEKKVGANNYGIKSLRALLETKAGQPEKGLAILKALKRVAPVSPFVLSQMKEIYQQLPDWEGLGLLLPDLEKHKVVDAVELHSLQEKVYHHRLVVASRESLESMQLVFHDLPKSLRNSELLVGLYLQKLLEQDEDSESGVILTNFLKRQWSDNLIGMVGFLKGGNPQHLLLLLEGWMKERPNNAVLMLTLGRLSLRNQLWGKARDYFEYALKASKSNALTAEISAELGRLLEHLGESQKSLENYQLAMSLMDHKLPDLPMPAMNR